MWPGCYGKTNANLSQIQDLQDSCSLCHTVWHRGLGSKQDTEGCLHAMEMLMLHRISGISLLIHITNDAIQQQLGLLIAEKIRESQLHWCRHVLRVTPSTATKIAFRLTVDGRWPRGQDISSKDMQIFILQSD
ncbi:hypothetical protein JRQ81_015872 [Phrynocephalus forsythii]|uniref:Uncharacterized protein n=1 Tax=Phrynocephalus forsythii TaxID=171643 RepID=A0A9Q0XUS1_9SAUR|nr:hypothetical protein JRQ81_015872 [Phrynocephalus forsythii]